jgi:predicted dienelactone hydrolase
METRHLSRGFAPALLILAIASVPANLTIHATAAGPGGYKVDAGPWKVASEDLVLRDERRQKDLEITVRYPVVDANAAGRFPLVVFSHGAGGSRAAFPDLTAHWASHGYIVVLPTHSAARRQPPAGSPSRGRSPATSTWSSSKARRTRRTKAKARRSASIANNRRTPS